MVGGDKMLNVRVITNPMSWADGMSVIRTEDLRAFSAQDVRHRKTVQIRGGGELTIVSVRLLVPTHNGESRSLWVPCVEQSPCWIL